MGVVFVGDDDVVGYLIVCFVVLNVVDVWGVVLVFGVDEFEEVVFGYGGDCFWGDECCGNVVFGIDFGVWGVVVNVCCLVIGIDCFVDDVVWVVWIDVEF